MKRLLVWVVVALLIGLGVRSMAWNVHDLSPQGIRNGLYGQIFIWLIELDANYGEQVASVKEASQTGLDLIWQQSDDVQRQVMQQYLMILAEEEGIYGQGMAPQPARPEPVISPALLTPSSAP